MIWNQLKCYELKEACLFFLLRTLDWIKISKFNQSWFETGNFIDLERVEDKLQRFQPEGNANCGWTFFNVYQKVKILQVIWYSQDIPNSLEDHPQKEKKIDTTLISEAAVPPCGKILTLFSFLFLHNCWCVLANYDIK